MDRSGCILKWKVEPSRSLLNSFNLELTGFYERSSAKSWKMLFQKKTCEISWDFFAPWRSLYAPQRSRFFEQCRWAVVMNIPGFCAFKVRLAITSSASSKLVWIDMWTRLALFYLCNLSVGVLFGQRSGLTFKPKVGMW